MHQPPNLLAIVGPTASGKTGLAVACAKAMDGEVISADSRQVYRGLDIGAGKDLHEYQGVPYHLIDIVDPGYEYSVFDFQKDFVNAFDDIKARKKMPILCGGTGLYIDAALRGYRMIEVPENRTLRKTLANKTHEQLLEHLLVLKPRQHNTTDTEDRERLIRAIEIAEGESRAREIAPYFPTIHPLTVGIRWEREALRKRITERLKYRLTHGLIDEVKHLHAKGVSWDTLYFYGLEYRFIARYLQGHLNHNDMYQKLNAAIHQFAKKQDTWFRKMERRGTRIHWLEADRPIESSISKINELMKEAAPL